MAENNISQFASTLFGSESKMDSIFDSLKGMQSSQVNNFIGQNFGSLEKFQGIAAILQASGKLNNDTISQWPDQLKSLVSNAAFASIVSSLASAFFNKNSNTQTQQSSGGLGSILGSVVGSVLSGGSKTTAQQSSSPDLGAIIGGLGAVLGNSSTSNAQQQSSGVDLGSLVGSLGSILGSATASTSTQQQSSGPDLGSIIGGLGSLLGGKKA